MCSCPCIIITTMSDNKTKQKFAENAFNGYTNKTKLSGYYLSSVSDKLIMLSSPETSGWSSASLAISMYFTKAFLRE